MADEARSLLPEEELPPINPRQMVFVEEYLIDLNATQAAIRAGYSPQSAEDIGGQLLRNSRVRAHVDTALAARSKRTGVNADRLLLELARIALADPLKVIDALTGTVKDDAVVDDTAAIQSIKVKTIPQRATREDPCPDPIIEREVRLYDKTRAIELAGKFIGLVLDRRELTGKNGGPVEVAGRVQNLSTAELLALLKKASETGGEPDGDASP